MRANLPTPSEIDLLAAQAAIDAAKEVYAYGGGIAEARRKRDGSLVTDFDVEIEQRAIAAIASTHPADRIISEEMNPSADLPKTERFWTIDPIDGTANFVAGLPFFATSISLYSGSRGLYAATYCPATNETISREAGGELLLNGRSNNRLPGVLRNRPVVVDHIVAEAERESSLRLQRQAAVAGIGVRSLGSAATALAYLALGRIRAYAAPRVRVWDVLPGLVLLGGISTFKVETFYNHTWADGQSMVVYAENDDEMSEVWARG